MSTHSYASTSLPQAPALPRVQLWLPLKRALLIVSGWTMYTVFFTTQYALGEVYNGHAVPWGKLLLMWSVCGCIWSILTPFIMWLSSRFSIDRETWWSHGVIHLAGAFGAALIHATAYSVVVRWVGWAALTGHLPLWETVRMMLPQEIHADFLIYGLLVGAHHGFQYYTRYREREVKASQLEARLAEAQLQALKMQLHPHFLFNTLNTISVLMLDDVESANRTLMRLSSLLRTALDGAGVQRVPLAKEVEFLQAYLDIEQTRFQDRLTVRFDIDPSVSGAAVPNLLLQPLVENAIRHGVARRAGTGSIDISAKRDGLWLKVTVRDDGPGLSAKPSPDGCGVGVSNTRARLLQMYGSSHHFSIENAEDGGVRVLVAIPFDTTLA